MKPSKQDWHELFFGIKAKASKINFYVTLHNYHGLGFTARANILHFHNDHLTILCSHELWSSLLNNTVVTSCLLQSALMFSRLRWPNLLARQTQHTSWRHQRRHISQRCKCLNWKLTYLLPLSKRCRTPGLSHIQYLKCMRPGLPSESTGSLLGHLKIPSDTYTNRWQITLVESCSTNPVSTGVSQLCYYKSKTALQILLCCKFMAAQEHRGHC